MGLFILCGKFSTVVWNCVLHVTKMCWLGVFPQVESPCERSPCMQWEGQDLHAQLFSPTGPAQEVPVSPRLTSDLPFDPTVSSPKAGAYLRIHGGLDFKQ